MIWKPFAFATRTFTGPRAGMRREASFSVTRVRLPKAARTVWAALVCDVDPASFVAVTRHA